MRRCGARRGASHTHVYCFPVTINVESVDIPEGVSYNGGVGRLLREEPCWCRCTACQEEGD